MARRTFKTLGRRVTKFIGFETFTAPRNIERVVAVSDEVTALCPVTGQPDWYTVAVSYVPNKLCVESKSLKLYLQSIRQRGEFCENLSSIMCDDLFCALKPAELKITITQKARGGVSIVAESSRTAGV
jgi:7-cyano-7-deazaguanine reductase